MAEGLEATLASMALERLTGPGHVIIEALEAGEGVRLGQCAVLSTKVHAFNSHSPEHVQVMVDADAGQVFYQRQDSGTICHLDIFHQCGSIDHVLAARYVCQAVDFYHKLPGAEAELGYGGFVNPDLIDIQTAAGGGRITGSLTGGQKESLCRVHENHVHLALQLPYDHIRCLFFIVAAIETAILTCGCELRCNEQISCIYSADTQADLNPYTAQTDSQLTARSKETQRRSPGSKETVDSKQAGTGGRQGKPGSADGNKEVSGVCQSQTLVDSKENSRDFTSYHDQDVMAQVTLQSSFYPAGLSDSIKQAIHGSRSRQGAAISSSITQRNRHFDGQLISGADRSRAIALDVAATVTAAACHFAEQSGGRLRVRPADLRFAVRRASFSYNVCLLIDSSASMAGSRLTAARCLAAEILRGGCNRVSVVTFQDNRAEVLTPFTPSRQAVWKAFDSITPYGATPLALGLRYSLAYFREKQLERPLLVLITDGVPSRIYEETANPLIEALAAANEIKQSQAGFLCIGLDTDDGFLKKLTAAADGVLYRFTEFETQFRS